MRERAAAFVVVGLCVVALALAASSLSAPQGGEYGGGEGTGSGFGDDPQGVPNESLNSTSTGAPLIPPRAVELAISALVVLILVALVAARRSTVAAAVLFVAFVGGYLVFITVFGDPGAALGAGIDAPQLNASALSEGGGDAGSQASADTERSTTDRPSALLFGVVGVAILAAVGVILAASASSDERVDVEEPEPDGESDRAVGAAAGRAADRIAAESGADLSNAVYEAWYEMATAVDIDAPATATPGEFADAARDADVDPDAVDDLTTVFEAVRYGDEPADDYEDRALAALRRIEAGQAVGDRAGDPVESSGDASSGHRAGEDNQ